MADKKISELTSLPIADGADVFPIVDVDTSETKKIALTNLMGAPGPVGAISPSSGEFTSLQLPTGSSVVEFSTDTTLAGNSNTVISTERAVKTYIDNQITNLENKLDLINVRYVYSDTTASAGDIVLVDTTSGNVNIELIGSTDGKITVKKVTTDGNNINISTLSGTIDGQVSVTIDTAYQTYEFVSNGYDFFVI